MVCIIRPALHVQGTHTRIILVAIQLVLTVPKELLQQELEQYHVMIVIKGIKTLTNFKHIGPIKKLLLERKVPMKIPFVSENDTCAEFIER